VWGDLAGAPSRPVQSSYDWEGELGREQIADERPCGATIVSVNLRHLEIIYGIAGAREKFEEMMGHLIRSQHSDASRVRIVVGDGGIDIHTGIILDPAGIDIFQVKYFPAGIDECQRGQVRDSFKRVRESIAFKTNSWTLCVPVDLSIDEKTWFATFTDHQAASGIVIKTVMGAAEVERLLMKPENQDIREEYFKLEHMQVARQMSTTLRAILAELSGLAPRPVILSATLDAVRSRRAYRFDADNVVVEIQFCYTVMNGSETQTAEGWNVRTEVGPIEADVCFTSKTFSRIGEGPSYSRSDNKLLPLQEATTESLIGLKVHAKKDIEAQLHRILEPAKLKYRAVSHNFAADPVIVALKDVIVWPALLTEVTGAFLIDIGEHPGKDPL